MLKLAFETDERRARARIGLIVLETDRTVEIEVQLAALDGVEWHHSRIANDAEVSTATLTDMEQRLPDAASLLPRAFDFDAIGYACTSAATLIGDTGVSKAIHRSHPGVPCTTPISAAIAAFETLDASRIAVLTPYVESVTLPIIEYFETAGLEISAVGSFAEPNDLVVSKISVDSIAAGIRELMQAGGCDAVFVSCTALRVLADLDALEAQFGVPVISSNAALIWHLLRVAGVDDNIDGLGQLLRRSS